MLIFYVIHMNNIDNFLCKFSFQKIRQNSLSKFKFNFVGVPKTCFLKFNFIGVLKTCFLQPLTNKIRNKLAS